MEKFIHEIKLPEKDEFSKRFNRVSELFEIAQKEDTKEAWVDYFEAKFCLEQGLPMSFTSTYTQTIPSGSNTVQNTEE